MESIFLSGKKARELRAEGHHLNPAVMIGKDGLTPQVLHSIRKVLDTNPLIKIKILDTTDMNRKQFAAELAENTSSQVAQVLGKTILLYREPEED
ncbi:ribosome assembly RNA-binding protein YhbY [candidate division KSB1 bacterium]|nr:ribosome assembly RNA-binding protein YhbY [candidate division KSB1 bacterium]